MTVHFIGAGPGAADLITVRGRDIIARAPVCLYAGSLVPKALLDHCPLGARIVDTAPLSLDEIVAALVPHYGADCPVAVVYRASWPEERVIRATLDTIAAEIAKNPIDS